MPWGDKALTVLRYDRSPQAAVQDAQNAMAELGTLEGVHQLDEIPGTPAPVWQVLGHFRYGLKRLGQKTRVHVFIAGHEHWTYSMVAVEAQGGDVWGKASRAGEARFLELLGQYGSFEITT